VIVEKERNSIECISVMYWSGVNIQSSPLIIEWTPENFEVWDNICNYVGGSRHNHAQHLTLHVLTSDTSSRQNNIVHWIWNVPTASQALSTKQRISPPAQNNTVTRRTNYNLGNTQDRTVVHKTGPLLYYHITSTNIGQYE